MTNRLKYEPVTPTEWSTQVINYTSKSRSYIKIFLLRFSATKIVTCKCHVNDLDGRRYNMIISSYKLTSLGIDNKISDNNISFT